MYIYDFVCFVVCLFVFPFKFSQQDFGPDLEVLPCPGHCLYSTVLLINMLMVTFLISYSSTQNVSIWLVSVYCR